MTFPLWYQLQVFGIEISAVFVIAAMVQKKKGFVIILFCGLVYVCCAEYCTYVLHVPFRERNNFKRLS